MSNKINSEWKHLRHFHIQKYIHTHSHTFINKRVQGIFPELPFRYFFYFWLRGKDEKKHEIKIIYEEKKTLKDMKFSFYAQCAAASQTASLSLSHLIFSLSKMKTFMLSLSLIHRIPMQLKRAHGRLMGGKKAHTTHTFCYLPLSCVAAGDAVSIIVVVFLVLLYVK